MSRIGKKPVEIPEKVSVSIDNCNVSVQGPKGSLACKVSQNVSVSQQGQELIFEIAKSCNPNVPQVRADYGTSRALVANLITGVVDGYQKSLELEGVGYNAKLEGQTLVLNVGYSHQVKFELPKEINCQVEKNTTINLDSINKQLLGNFAAKIRKSCPPEPYLGKGIRYAGERVRRKAGKTGGK